MPNERYSLTPFCGLRDGNIIWFGEGDDRRAALVLQVAAYYRSEGQDPHAKKFVTERTFRIGKRMDDWYYSQVMLADDFARFSEIEWAVTECGPRYAR